MPNTNCLEGVKCPKCQQEDNFSILATVWVDVIDSGTDSGGDTCWDEKSPMQCCHCNHEATLDHFTIDSRTYIEARIEALTQDANDSDDEIEQDVINLQIHTLKQQLEKVQS